MNNRLLFILTAALISAGAPVASVSAEEATAVPVYVDGRAAETAGRLLQGRTMVPADFLVDELGLTVEQPDPAAVVVSGGNRTIRFRIEEASVEVDGHEVSTDAPPLRIGAVLHLPLRFVAERTGYGVHWDGDRRLVELRRLEENSITIHTEKVMEETDALKLKIQYPRISGLADPEVEQRINERFAQKAEAFRANSVKEAQALASVLAPTDPEQPRDDPRRVRYEADANYQIRYNRNGLLSLNWSEYTYGGGAHGVTVKESFTIDLESGKVLALQDLFLGNIDYQALLDYEIRKQVADREIPLLTPFEGIDEQEDYYLTDEYLVIYFQLYEYTPYAFGFPEFPVPLSSLSDLLAIPGLAG